MWLGQAFTHGLLLTFITILNRNTVNAEAEQTTALANVLSTVTTEPPSNVALKSSVYSETKPNTQPLKMKNISTSINTLLTNGYSIISTDTKDIIINSSALFYASKAIPEASTIRGEIPTRISSSAKLASSSVYRIESSPLMKAFNDSKKTVVPIMAVQASTTSKQETSPILIHSKERNENATRRVIFSQTHSVSMALGSSIQPKHPTVSSNTPRQSTILNTLASSNHEQSSITLSLHGKANTSDTEETSFTVSMPWENFKIMMLTTTSVKSMHPNSGKSQMINITASTAPPESKSNRAIVVVTKEKNTSIPFIRATKSFPKTEVSASYSRNISEKAHMKANSTKGISTSEIKQANKTAVLEPSPSLVSKQNRSEIKVVFTSPAVNITEMLYSKISKGRFNPTRNDTTVQHSTSKSGLLANNYTSKMNSTKEKRPDKTTNLENFITSSPVEKLDSLNKTLIPTPVPYISSLERYVSSDMTAIANRTTMASHILMSGQFSKISSNQTHIAKNVTTFRMIQPSTIIHYSTRVSTRPTSSPTKFKVQQFRVTIKITSETFRNEYITSARAFRQKSNEIAEQFDRVFKDMEEYLFTEVLRFFNGSLGCDVVIHTESVESKPVSIDRISNTLKQAKSTKGGFGKYVVGNIDVEEKSPDVKGRDDDDHEDKKETWGRMPIIVISILAGLCLVLFVMVITQCIQKRHYSHSLADSNEIQEYSPAIQLKYNDDGAFKDEERVPMTTFNQTDIY
ncbi:Hypothetical predicted protein [Paramuricea clavata]|uniref:Uncharacterized protein n=1 Tax=Paramuricea clavata TaxID=317549 RepID=A0A7D9JH62_PARCT|nr:Hypothetical predicted protein [Paramuricea clavata]